MSEPLNQLLADGAAQIVHENFTDVAAEWWWERRIGGGIAICQTFDPSEMSLEISRELGVSVSRVREVSVRELGLEDFEPVTLTFEVSGDESAEGVARILSERSSTSRGIADGLHRRVEESVIAAISEDSE